MKSYHRSIYSYELEVTSGDHLVQLLTKAGSPTKACTGRHPSGSWISPKKETPQALWSACSTALSPLYNASFHNKGSKYYQCVYPLFNPTYAKLISKSISFFLFIPSRIKYFPTSGEKQKLKPAEIQLYSRSTLQCFLNEHHFTKWIDNVSYKFAKVIAAIYYWLENINSLRQINH